MLFFVKIWNYRYCHGNSYILFIYVFKVFSWNTSLSFFSHTHTYTRPVSVPIYTSMFYLRRLSCKFTYLWSDSHFAVIISILQVLNILWLTIFSSSFKRIVSSFFLWQYRILLAACEKTCLLMKHDVLWTCSRNKWGSEM